MGIDEAFFERIAAIGAEQDIFSGAAVAILGDCRFHTAWASGDNRADLRRFAERLGVNRAETLDIMGGPTIQIDLHESLPPHLAAQFDVVIDAGTLHCCFDVATVLKNCMQLLKERGAVFHLSALSGYFGRAYYSFNPLLFKDFYLQNGFLPLAFEQRVPRAEACLSPWRRLLNRKLGRKVGAFSPIEIDGLHLEAAGPLAMKFGRDVSQSPAMIPNDAVVMFAAHRDRAAPFVRPVPSFFAANASVRGAKS